MSRFDVVEASVADLRAALLSYQPELPGSRILPGNYGSNALAIGYAKDRSATAAFVKDFTRSVTASGFVTRAIEKAGVQGAVDERAEPDLRRERETAPDVALAPAEHRGVDRDHERLVSGRRRPVDHVGDKTPVAPHVHLEPQSRRTR